jgi:hypothetical protein
MNCKPGDLAVYVGGHLSNPRNVGRIFQVLRRGNDWHGQISWWVKPAGEAYSPTRLKWMSEEGEVLDKLLRPIRDPGDDATDETLLWVGSPHKETA